MVRITIGTLIDRILDYHSTGIERKYIQKPWAWALYETWKRCELMEEPKDADKEESE